MANMVEGGDTPILSKDRLQALGFSLVIFPGGVVRAIAQRRATFYADAWRATARPTRFGAACSISTRSTP